MAQPIEVHYWPTPNGHKVTIALEEMGLPYTIVPVNIGKGEQFEPKFLAISPNNRMPAIVDPDGPDGKPISVFESGAILQYLARKTGQFYGADERARTAVDEWLFWQMAGLGPNAGQANHFRNYAPQMNVDARQTAYGTIRYTNELHRLYGVLNKRLADHEYMAGDYSIADMATYPWTSIQKQVGIVIEEFPNVVAWRRRISARPAVQAALKAAEPFEAGGGLQAGGKAGEEARKVLFGQRAR